MKYMINFLVLVVGLGLGSILTIFHKDINLLKDADKTIVNKIKELTKNNDNSDLVRKLHEDINNSLNKDKEILRTAINTLGKLQEQVTEIKEEIKEGLKKEKTYNKDEVCEACELQKCLNKPKEVVKPVVKKQAPRKVCDERKVQLCLNEKLNTKNVLCREVKTKEKVQTHFKSKEKDINLLRKEEVDTVIIAIEPSKPITPSNPICFKSVDNLRLECRRDVCN